MLDWFNKKKNDVLNITWKELFFLLVSACIYYIVSMFIMDTLKAPRLTAEHPMIDGAIYITTCFLIIVFTLIAILHFKVVSRSVSYRTFTNIKHSGATSELVAKL